MCTVLQQHLAKNPVPNEGQNGVCLSPTRSRTPEGLLDGRSGTPHSSYYNSQPRDRTLSPTGRRSQTPGYSYLGPDTQPSLKRPIDPYDRKVSTPAMHFHVPPPNPDGTRPTSRQMNAYTQGLLGRRSRSHSRTGMRVLVDQIKASTPRPKSPHMNNEEPIKNSHYPAGEQPEEGTEAPIERPDFPAPPYYAAERRKKKRKRGRAQRRPWSEPGKRMPFCKDTDTEEESQEDLDDDDDSPYESSSSDIDPKEIEIIDHELDKKEAELRKIQTGMGSVFLNEIAVERERRKSAKNRPIDPRSAARTPAANRMPHYKLRYLDPTNQQEVASPSRIADHNRPWDEEGVLDGMRSSQGGRSNVTTPFLPNTPLGRVVSPVNAVKPGYTQTANRSSTLPSRFSPYADTGAHSNGHGYSTDFSSKSDYSDGGGGHSAPQGGGEATPGGTLPTPGGASSSDGGHGGHHGAVSGSCTEGSLGHESGYSGDGGAYIGEPLRAPNVYPLHLLYTTNYRLPGDVDRANLERHMTDKDFDLVFKGMSRSEFYQLPYWNRCEIKKKANLF